MNRHLRLTAAVTLMLLGVIEANAAVEKRKEAWKLSPETIRVLDLNALKLLAREDPAGAIQRLDEIRSVEASSAIDSAIAEVALRAGLKAQPDEAIGLLLRAASETAPQPTDDLDSVEGSAVHSNAVEGLIVALQQPGSTVLDDLVIEVTGPLTQWELSWVNVEETWAPATHEFIPAEYFDRVKTKADATRPGIGLPVVAKQKEGVADPNFSEGGVFPIFLYAYPLTAILELDGPTGESLRKARLQLLDPRRRDTYTLAGVETPLAFDFGVQIGALRQEINLTFAKKGAIHSGKYLTKVGIYPLEPLRADKIPVVLIHGLTASIRTWVEAHEAFVADPALRQRYQFSLFTYPTGLPFAYTAMLLRRALVEMVTQLDPTGEAPLLQRIVLIGHSMGGLLTRLQVTDSGEDLWNTVFEESPEDADLSTSDGEFMREILIFNSLPFVERVVFCSTPHRGADMASSRIGKIGISMVKLPDELKEVGKGIVSDNPDALTGRAAERRKFPDGVQSLQPDYDLILALDKLSIDDRVTYHSIIGDRGKGDSPESSDGLVAYWSSHLDGASSEQIVPSGHSSHKSDEGVAELVRILHLHLDDG